MAYISPSIMSCFVIGIHPKEPGDLISPGSLYTNLIHNFCLFITIWAY